MTKEVIVTWTTPFMRAQRLLYEIGEDLEFKRREEALAKLEQHLAEIRELSKFIETYPSLIYQEKRIESLTQRSAEPNPDRWAGGLADAEQPGASSAIGP